MKLENLTNLIHDEAKKIAKTTDEEKIIYYDMLLRDIIALSLSLRHQDSANMKTAGNKMLRNLQYILDEHSDLHRIISELHFDSGENISKDKEVIENTSAHCEFLDLCHNSN